MDEHPEDICECGDYRSDHPDNGPCDMNDAPEGIPHFTCERFRLAEKFAKEDARRVNEGATHET